MVVTLELEATFAVWNGATGPCSGEAYTYVVGKFPIGLKL